MRDQCAPVSSAGVRIEWDHTDSRGLRAIFTHKAVGVRPVREVFSHQGNSDSNPLYVVNGTLDLTEGTREQSKREK